MKPLPTSSQQLHVPFLYNPLQFANHTVCQSHILALSDIPLGSDPKLKTK